MAFRTDWEALSRRHEAWWNFQNSDRPLMWIEAEQEPEGEIPEISCPVLSDNPYEDGRINPYLADTRLRAHAAHTKYLAEAFPNAALDFGPGAMGAFLGCKTHFAKETVWYEPLCEEPAAIAALRPRFDTEIYQKAVSYHKTLVELSRGEYLVGIPDLIDSMDTISAMLGPMNALYALYDEPEDVLAASDNLDELYFTYYEQFRDITLRGGNAMTVQAFAILGSRVAKLQCDMSAMISPKMFNGFVAPSLAKYCARLSHAMYHIDGEGEMCHVDTMLTIPGLDAFQWIPRGASTGTAFTDERFYPMFDKIHEAGKGLYLAICEGDVDDWARSTRRMLDRYGSRGMYFLYPRFPDVKTAEDFIKSFE